MDVFILLTDSAYSAIWVGFFWYNREIAWYRPRAAHTYMHSWESFQHSCSHGSTPVLIGHRGTAHSTQRTWVCIILFQCLSSTDGAIKWWTGQAYTFFLILTKFSPSIHSLWMEERGDQQSWMSVANVSPVLYSFPERRERDKERLSHMINTEEEKAKSPDWNILTAASSINSLTQAHWAMLFISHHTHSGES